MLFVALLSWSSNASAHLTPNSEVRLDIGHDEVRADIIVPRGEYAYATNNPIDRSAGSLRRAHAYLASHLSVEAKDGRAWNVKIGSVSFVQIAGPPDLHATAVFTPPSQRSVRDFIIDWHVLVDVLPNHFALFVLDDDVGGQVAGNREILGAVRAGSTKLVVDRGSENGLFVFASAVRLGIHHIIEGYDHIMFLLALLLPAPLIASAGRWSERRSIKQTLLQLTKIVTSFTIGHSITLVGATLGGWKLPVTPVEVAIAVSVLVSAIHAIRPLVPGREPLIAIGFGLIHGLAFATLIQHSAGGAQGGALSLLGFNVGIEIVQLAIVSAVAPSLLILARYPLYGSLRVCLAGLAVFASLAWIFNRTMGIGDQFVRQMESVMAYAGWGAIALATLAGLVWVQTRGRGVFRSQSMDFSSVCLSAKG